MATTSDIGRKTFTLNSGLEFPAVGLGTFQDIDRIGKYGADNDLAVVNSIAFALKSGYRLIDTAQLYGVEALVGQGIRTSGIPRSEITVVTKMSLLLHDDPAESLEVSLRAMELDYIDVFLMHWPISLDQQWQPLPPGKSPTFIEAWQKMERLVGPKCKSIGVSNFSQKTLDDLLKTATVVPAVNQIELHPLNPARKLVPYCQERGIHVMSYSTIGAFGPKSPILTDHMFTKIAQAHNCAIGAVSLSWAVQRGATVIPKSTNPDRILTNAQLVVLTENEMSVIDSACERLGRWLVADRHPEVIGERDGYRTFFGWTSVDLGWEDEQKNWLL